MKYEYVLYLRHDTSKDEIIATAFNPQEILKQWGAREQGAFAHSWYQLVINDYCTGEQLAAYLDLERFASSVWFHNDKDPHKEMLKNTPSKDPVNPSHYQRFVMDLQWIETKQYTSMNFEAAIQLQVEKYLDRLGKKDEEIQELKKAFWYLGFWIAYKINDKKPIKVKDIPELLDISNIWKG